MTDAVALESLIRIRLEDPAAQIVLSSDDFGNERLAVQSDAFEGLPHSQRLQLLPAEALNSSIRTYHLLTSLERLGQPSLSEEYGSSDENLPLWPQQLSKGGREEFDGIFPSRELETLTPPVVSTFYSLRGGVGRSTALANVARILSSKYRVVCVDLDLEAPGLASLLGVESQVREGMGVANALLQIDLAGEVPDLDAHFLRTADGSLTLMPAGKPSSDYARVLSQLDPGAWYQEAVNPLRLLIDAIRRHPSEPEVVLIDSRTGISPISAPLIFEQSDLSIIAFFPHPQAYVGTKALTRALVQAKSARKAPDGRQYSPEPRFIASPLPPAPELLEVYTQRSIEWVEDWLGPALPSLLGSATESVEELIQAVPYSEMSASSDAVDQGSSAYAPVAAWIEGFLGESPSSPKADPATDKSEVLQSLRFTGGTAEEQEEDDFQETFLQTETVTRAQSLTTPIVVGRKGTGKTALFRRMAKDASSIVITAPPGLPEGKKPILAPDTYAALDQLSIRHQASWSTLWTAIVALSALRELGGAPQSVLDLYPALQESLSKPSTARQFTIDVESILSSPGGAFLAAEILEKIDASFTESYPRLLLFDGLDTGFGSSTEGRMLRQKAISGLLELIISSGREFRNISFKVLLRDDLWRESRLVNKSHLYSRTVFLAWSSQEDYLRVGIKQAMRSEKFRALLEQRTLSLQGFNLITPVDYWPDSLIYDAWVLLAGERVSGGKTAFTYNWVWSRLSDGNDDHSPRTLLQLLNEASRLERQLYEVNRYDRSLIRPRALVESLDEVSEQAVISLQEEFPELDHVLNELQRIGRTPFSADELQVENNLQVLAEEVGLLWVSPKGADDGDTLRVPELYRKALRMGRRGQK